MNIHEKSYDASHLIRSDCHSLEIRESGTGHVLDIQTDENHGCSINLDDLIRLLTVVDWRSMLKLDNSRLDMDSETPEELREMYDLLNIKYYDLEMSYYD